MSESYYYHITNASPAVDFTVNGVDYGSFNFISVFTTDDGASGSIDGIPQATWNDHYAADAGASPGTFTLTTNFTNGNAMMYGGGAQANGIGGGVLEISSGSFSGNQTVLGGSLILDTSVQASSTFNLNDAYLDFEGGTGGASITFNEDSTVKLSASPISGNNTNFNGLTMTNFADGDGIAAPTGYKFDTTAAPVYTAGTPHGTLTFVLIDESTGARVSVTLNMDVASGTSSDFSYTTDSEGDSVLALGDYVPCFLEGTLIATPEGDRAVESLKIGDRISLANGGSVPVKWIGRRGFHANGPDGYRRMDPLIYMPIRIKAGALGDNLPTRDLLLSPDHAVLIDSVLVQASALVNGVSVVRQTQLPEAFTYYHIELDNHDLILAEGVVSETFVDNVTRMGFDNWDEHEALYPNPVTIPEMDFPRAQSHRQVPNHIHQMLGDRVKALLATDMANVIQSAA